MSIVAFARRIWTNRGPWDVWIGLLLLVAAALAWAFTIELVQHEYAAVTREAQKQNLNLAIALEEHTDRTLKSVEQGLAHLAATYLAEGSQLDIRKAIESGELDIGLAVDFGAVDEKGIVVASRVTSRGVDLSHRDQFRVHELQTGPEMVIGSPLFGEISRKWIIPMSRRVSRADGSFAGAVYAAVDPNYFTGFYRQANLGTQGLITLINANGIALARRVGESETFGVDMRGSALLSEHAQRPAGSFVGRGVDGVERFYTYRTLGKYQLIVVVGTARSEVLAGFRERSRYYYFGAGLATVLIALAAVAVVSALAHQRRATNELGLQRTVLATVQQTLLDAVLLVDENGKIVSANRRFLDLWGVPEELMRHREDALPLKFVTDQVEDPDAFRAKVLHLYEHKDEASQDELHTRDGRTIDRYSAPVVGAEGAYYGRVWVFRDVTARRRAEDELRASEQRFRQLTEAIGEAFWMASPDFRSVTYVSPAFERITGRTRDELQADPRVWLEAIHVDDRDRVRSALTALANGTTYDIEYRFRHADGGERWVNARGYPVRDAAGAVIQLSGVAADITGRKRDSEQLRLSAMAFESIGDGVIVTDAARRIVSVNKAYCAISGYEAADLIGKTPRIFQSGRHDAAFYEAMWRDIRETGHWRGEVWSRRSNGEIFPELLSISTVKDGAGATTHYVGVCTDISEVKRYEAQLEHQARHDALTGLPNRLLFEDRCNGALGQARRSGGRNAVLFLDLDHFKSVNDSLGHAAGDVLLQECAKRLLENVRKTDTVARFGGDEFAVLLEAITDTNAEKVARKILVAMAAPFPISGHNMFVSVSVGVSFYPDDGADTATLLKNADTALYQAKADGRNSVRFFSADMNARALENMMMTNALRLALERDELVVHYQPCMDLGSGRVRSVEALVRWNHPELGLLPPARFIPLAEESGLIEPVGERVLEIACRQMRQWHDAGYPLARVAVNLSPRQFRLTDLPQRIAAVLAASGLPGKHLELEVTEGVMMRDPEAAAGVLRKLKSLGISIAVDDFGTGYSSLSYLKSLPIDFLKIDKSFVSGVPSADDDVAIIRAIVAMANSLGLAVIAEGVETKDQHLILAELGCDEAQGWLFSKALPHAEVTALLAAEKAGARSVATA